MPQNERQEWSKDYRGPRRAAHAGQRGGGPGYLGEAYGEEYSPTRTGDDSFEPGFDDQGHSSSAWNQTASGSYRGVGPRNTPQKTDTELHNEICRRLTRHGQLDARNIEVKVEHGEAVLLGSVQKRADKRRAENVALSVEGIWDVHNRLQLGDQGSELNRIDKVGRSGVHPVSGPLPEGDAPVVDVGSWGSKPHQG
jgi:hypothetical protein